MTQTLRTLRVSTDGSIVYVFEVRDEDRETVDALARIIVDGEELIVEVPQGKRVASRRFVLDYEAANSPAFIKAGETIGYKRSR
jgi:chorismate-pyruvate lyase